MLLRATAATIAMTIATRHAVIYVRMVFSEAPTLELLHQVVHAIIAR